MTFIPKRFRPKVTTIKESKDLDTSMTEGSLKTYHLSLPPVQENKSLALKTVKEKSSDKSDNDTIKDTKFAQIENLRIFLGKVRDKVILVNLGKIKEGTVTLQMPKRVPWGIMNAKVLIIINLGVQIIKKPGKVYGYYSLLQRVQLR